MSTYRLQLRDSFGFGRAAEQAGYLSALGVAKFKWPERLEWVSEMPKTPIGKIDKKALQADITAKLAAGQTGEGR